MSNSRRALLRRLAAASCLIVGAEPGAAPAPARPGVAPAAAHEPGVERVAISLQQLDSSLATNAAARKPVPADLSALAGGNWPEALVQTDDGDTILVLQRQPGGRPALPLDLLLDLYRHVLQRSRSGGPAPHCSLDPQPASIKAVRRLEGRGNTIRSVDDFKRYAAQIQTAWNTTGQKVRVGGTGIERDGATSHACITADLLMKAHSQGLKKLEGVPSLIERSLDAARRGVDADAGGSMARFWFVIADAEQRPRFVFEDKVMAIDKLQVAVRTEAQVVGRDGKLHDAVNRPSPQMLAMADDFSRFMGSHPADGPYALLDASYRMLALLQAALQRKALDFASLPQLAQRQPFAGLRPMPDEVPGMANFDALVLTRTEGNRQITTTHLPLVMGGGDMEMRVDAPAFSRASPAAAPSLARLRKRALASRPAGGVVYWVF